MNIVNALTEQLKYKWPQSFCEHSPHSKYGYHLVVLPGFKLRKGYNKTICTVLFLARFNEKTKESNLTEFWVDLPDLALADNTPPERTWDCTGRYREFASMSLTVPYRRAGIWDGIPDFPHWKHVKLFLWAQQAFNPNKETLFTSAMLIKKRLDLVI